MIELKDIEAAVEQSLREVVSAGKWPFAGSADAQECAEGATGGLFVVEVKVRGDQVEVFIDSDARGADGRLYGVSVEDCIALSRAIESRFDRDVEDFSLTVSSAGIGQPLRVLRQYLKLVGKSVEVVLKDGTRLVATLEAVEPVANGSAECGGAESSGEAGGTVEKTGGVAGFGSITLSYPEKLKVEGKKRPQITTVTKTFAPDGIKTTKEHIDFN